MILPEDLRDEIKEFASKDIRKKATYKIELYEQCISLIIEIYGLEDILDKDDLFNEFTSLNFICSYSYDNKFLVFEKDFWVTPDSIGKIKIIVLRICNILKLEYGIAGTIITEDKIPEKS